MRDEIEKLKKQAEEKIAQVIADFEKTTGLETTDLGIEKRHDESTHRFITSSVSLQLVYR